MFPQISQNFCLISKYLFFPLSSLTSSLMPLLLQYQMIFSQFFKAVFAFSQLHSRDSKGYIGFTGQKFSGLTNFSHPDYKKNYKVGVLESSLRYSTFFDFKSRTVWQSQLKILMASVKSQNNTLNSSRMQSVVFGLLIKQKLGQIEICFLISRKNLGILTQCSKMLALTTFKEGNSMICDQQSLFPNALLGFFSLVLSRLLSLLLRVRSAMLGEFMLAMEFSGLNPSPVSQA